MKEIFANAEFVANASAYLCWRLIFNLITLEDVELAKRLAFTDCDFIDTLAGANIDNLPEAIKLASEEVFIDLAKLLDAHKFSVEATS